MSITASDLPKLFGPSYSAWLFIVEDEYPVSCESSVDPSCDELDVVSVVGPVFVGLCDVVYETLDDVVTADGLEVGLSDAVYDTPS